MLVLKAHQHQPQPSCRVPIQNTCCSEIGLITFARRCWRWTWWWLGQLGCEMPWEGRAPSKNPPVRRREAWRYPGSTAADGKSPAVVKGVRISPSMYILLTLGQILRDAEFSDYLVYNLHAVTYFLYFPSTFLHCAQLHTAIGCNRWTNLEVNGNFTGGQRGARTPREFLSQLRITFLRLIQCLKAISFH